MFKRSQVEWAIAEVTHNTQGRSGDPMQNLRVRINRLVDVDRQHTVDPKASKPESKRHAFFEGRCRVEARRSGSHGLPHRGGQEGRERGCFRSALCYTPNLGGVAVQITRGDRTNSVTVAGPLFRVEDKAEMHALTIQETIGAVLGAHYRR